MLHLLFVLSITGGLCDDQHSLLQKNTKASGMRHDLTRTSKGHGHAKRSCATDASPKPNNVQNGNIICPYFKVMAQQEYLVDENCNFDGILNYDKWNAAATYFNMGVVANQTFFSFLQAANGYLNVMAQDGTTGVFGEHPVSSGLVDLHVNNTAKWLMLQGYASVVSNGVVNLTTIFATNSPFGESWCEDFASGRDILGDSLGNWVGSNAVLLDAFGIGGANPRYLSFDDFKNLYQEGLLPSSYTPQDWELFAPGLEMCPNGCGPTMMALISVMSQLPPPQPPSCLTPPDPTPPPDDVDDDDDDDEDEDDEDD